MASETTEPQNPAAPGSNAPSNSAGAQANPGTKDSLTDAADELEEALIEVDESHLLREQLASAKAESEATRDKWLRAVAELENYKKRVKRDTDDAVQRALQNLLGDFLPVADNLERALTAMSGANDQVTMGVKMVQNVFTQALERHGITTVPGKGAAFDPAVHEALQQVPSNEYAPGKVVNVFEAGYVRNGRLIRPAKVVIASEDSSGTL